MGGSKVPDKTTGTTIQDLAPWALPYGRGLLDIGYEYYLPDHKWWVTDKNWQNGRLFDPGVDQWRDGDIVAGVTPGPQGLRDYDGPQLDETQFSDIENMAQMDALARAKSGSPLKGATDQFILDQMGGGAHGIARNSEAFFLGGPLAGASRESLLSALMGRTQYGAEDFLYDRWGPGSEAADRYTYDTLGQDAQLGRFGEREEIYGGLANSARGERGRTLRGDYLDSNRNPYVRANYDAAAKAVTDNYRYGTAPSTQAMFSQAGTFGGSAHRQLKSMQEFEFGRNLSDLANQMFGENYRAERANMADVAGSERAISSSMLDAARNRQTSLADAVANRGLQAAMDERGGWRQLLGMERGLEADLTRSSLDRNVSLAGLIPGLMSADYIDLDARRQIGKEHRDIADMNRDVRFQNQMREWEWGQRVLERLGSVLGMTTGNTSQTVSVQPTNSGTSPWLGGAALGLAALSALSGSGGEG